jgi:hypothetical protein
MASLFISYSHSDKQFAEKLAQDLKAYGIKVWIDEAEIKIGDSLIRKIREGIDRTEYFGVILSKASVQSEWVQTELDVAMNQQIEGKKVKVLPFLVEDCKLPGFLRGKLYADFRDDRNYSLNISKILQRLIVEDEVKIKIEGLIQVLKTIAKRGNIVGWDFLTFLVDVFGVDPMDMMYAGKYENKPLILDKKYISDIKELIKAYLNDTLHFRALQKGWGFDCIIMVSDRECMIMKNEALLMIYPVENLPTQFFSRKIFHVTGKIRLLTEILLIKQGYFFGFPFGLPAGAMSRGGMWLLYNNNEMVICNVYTKLHTFDYNGTISCLYFMNDNGVSIVCYGNLLGSTTEIFRPVDLYLEAIKRVQKTANKKVNKLIIVPDSGFLKLNINSKLEVINTFSNYMRKGVEIDTEIIVMDEEEIVKRLKEFGISYLCDDIKYKYDD